MSTMRQVAELAGVSAKTVSRVMRQDRYVSDEVRQRVERAIDELQYVPNMLARSFRSGRDEAIGVAVPEISDPFFATLTHAVDQVARARGVVVFVTSLGEEGEDERAGVETLLGRQIAGLIATPVSADQSYLRRWQPRTALVFIDRQPGKLNADSVVEDDFGGAHLATTHLIEHGHRRIGFIGDSMVVATTARRLEGYLAALRDQGISADPALISLGAVPDIEAGRVVSDLLNLPQPPSALFSSNARCSIEIVPALQRLHRTDVPLISFGDFPLASALQPALTVVDQNPDELGRVAANRLFERIDHPDRRLKRKIVLPVSLVLRSSCCVDQKPPAVERIGDSSSRLVDTA
jgi:LacI family transcriptional regulator